MIGARLGHLLDRPLAPLAKHIPVSPNIITVSGFLITAGAAIVLPFHLRLGAVLILIGGALDMLDGVVARTNSKATRFGALLDSTLDRYSDALIFIAIAWYFIRSEEIAGALLSMLTLASSFLISYVRARAEGLGISCNVGLVERPERVVLTVFGCLAGCLLPVLGILVLLSHVTIAQRLVHVHRALAEACRQG